MPAEGQKTKTCSVIIFQETPILRHWVLWLMDILYLRDIWICQETYNYKCEIFPHALCFWFRKPILKPENNTLDFNPFRNDPQI